MLSMNLEEREQQMPLLNRELDHVSVYPIIHMIREDICKSIDAPLTYEAMLAPDLTYSIALPLQEKYFALQRNGNPSIVFALLLNRVYFLRDTSFSTKALSDTRAMLCEILAIRTLRENETLLELAVVMTTSWSVFSGASDAVKKVAEEWEIGVVDPSAPSTPGADEDENTIIFGWGNDGANSSAHEYSHHAGDGRVGNAIEIAILGGSKRFIKSSACQKVINSIWSGKIVYSAESNHSILSDTYKRTPVHYYDPHKAPLLDHYRLKVPAVRSVLEYVNFLVLFVLFVVALEVAEYDRLTIAEIVFMLYALGFSLEKLAAMQEHGLKVYVTGTWNGFDILFVSIFMVYTCLRVYGIYWYEKWARNAGMDCLAIVAVLIFPRLAFATLSSNLMVLALRSMIIEFAFLMLLAAFCFAGFLYALWTLVRNTGHPYSAAQIAWWMLDLWFGLDASGFDRAGKFHPYWGPILMVVYACLSNTLLLTVLVSILSYTFQTISEDAAAEAMFRRAVYTIEGVKADAIFSYQPPLNLVALAFMLPSSYILSPRWFHKVNVLMIRICNFPILLAIAFYERQTRDTKATTLSEAFGSMVENMVDTLPRPIKRLSIFDGFFGQGGEIDAIFEIEDEVNGGTAIDEAGEAADGPATPMKRRPSSRDHHRGRDGSGSPRRSFRSAVRPKVESPRSETGQQQTHAISRPNAPSALPTSPTSPSSHQSPLAALYQGMADIPEIDISPSVEDGLGGTSGDQRSPLSPIHPHAPPPAPIAVRRRRLSSLGMLYRSPLDPSRQQAQNQPQPQRAVLTPKQQMEESKTQPQPVPGGKNSIPFSKSPDHLSPESPTPEPKTVQELEEQKEIQTGDLHLARRLQKVEENQEKIGALLEKILEKMSEKK